MHLGEQHVELAWHPASDGVDGELRLDAARAQLARDLGDRVLRLGHRKAVPWHDDHALGRQQPLGERVRTRLGVRRVALHLSGRAPRRRVVDVSWTCRGACRVGRCRGRAVWCRVVRVAGEVSVPGARLAAPRLARAALVCLERLEKHGADVAVHRDAHILREERARKADERADRREQRRREHEALGAERPPRRRVEASDDDGDVGAADGEGGVRADEERGGGARGERRAADGEGWGAHHPRGRPERDGAEQRVDEVALGQRDGRRAEGAVELAECDERAWRRGGRTGRETGEGWTAGRGGARLPGEARAPVVVIAPR